MQRIEDRFLNELLKVVILHDKNVLEVGCGEGTHSENLARECGILTAVDPDEDNIKKVRQKQISNVICMEGHAEDLIFPDSLFDVVVFTMSLHHVPVHFMAKAIDEAIRVKANGYIVVLEPELFGTFFDAEARFNAGDGDERNAKSAAFEAMRAHAGITLAKEMPAKAVVKFESFRDFVTTMKPKQNLNALEGFLTREDFTLEAPRRIAIFQPLGKQ